MTRAIVHAVLSVTIAANVPVTADVSAVRNLLVQAAVLAGCTERPEPSSVGVRAVGPRDTSVLMRRLSPEGETEIIVVCDPDAPQGDAP